MGDGPPAESTPPEAAPHPPLVIVLSGPSGAGKDSVIARMIERGLPIAFPPTMTDRAPREGETDGVDYRFVSTARFERHIAAGDLLEHALVYGDHKGVPRDGVRAALETGRHVVLRVDVQGAATLRERIPGALLVFLTAGDEQALEARIRGRGDSDEDDIARRIEEMRAEFAQAERFDHRVENAEGDLDGTVDALWAIIERAAARPGRAPLEV